MNRPATISILLLLIYNITATTAFGQERRPMERIHAAKMRYIAQKLHLPAEQQAGFDTVYQQYERERRDITLTFRKKQNNIDKTSDAEARQSLENDLDYQQQIIELKRRYNERFLKVISATQLAELHKAEREFKQALIQRLGQDI